MAAGWELMTQGGTAAVEEAMRSAKGTTRQPDVELMDIRVMTVVKQIMKAFIIVQRHRVGIHGSGSDGSGREAHKKWYGIHRQPGKELMG